MGQTGLHTGFYSTSSDMKLLFHEKPHCRLTEIKWNFRRNKLQRTNQGFNFLGGNFSKRDNVRAIQKRKTIQGERKKFLKNCKLTSYAIIFDQRTSFLSENLFSEENVSFSYSIITLLSKMAYCLRWLAWLI